MMNLLAVTSIYAGISGLIVLFLVLQVVRVRQRERVGIGDGANKQLNRYIRVHGNAVEFLPILLILLALSEVSGMRAELLHGFGVAIVLGRLLHAHGLGRSAGASFGRATGTILSLIALLGLSLALLGRAWWI